MTSGVNGKSSAGAEIEKDGQIDYTEFVRFFFNRAAYIEKRVKQIEYNADYLRMCDSLCCVMFLSLMAV